MAITNPTRAAADWVTQNTADIELLYDDIRDPHQQASPTLKLLLNEMKTEALGPSEEFGWPLILKSYSPTIAKKSMRFDAPDLDNMTRMTYTPAMMANSAGTNVVDFAHYKTDLARFNHTEIKVESMYKGYTEMFNHAIFSNWNESITDQRVDISAAQVAIAAEANPVPPEELFLNNVRTHADRILSIPMATRQNTTGHTMGNISSANAFWASQVTSQTGATVVESDGGTTTGNAQNTDVVTSVTVPQTFILDDIYEHLDAVQLGLDYRIYAACPRAVYRQLRGFIVGASQYQGGSTIGELGIRAAIEMEEYNVTFYMDPMMSWLWPYSIFFWSPDCMWLMSDSAFNPMGGTGIFPWQVIPGRTDLVTAMLHICQLVTVDPRGNSAIHGITAS